MTTEQNYIYDIAQVELEGTKQWGNIHQKEEDTVILDTCTNCTIVN